MNQYKWPLYAGFQRVQRSFLVSQPHSRLKVPVISHTLEMPLLHHDVAAGPSLIPKSYPLKRLPAVNISYNIWESLFANEKLIIAAMRTLYYYYYYSENQMRILFVLSYSGQKVVSVVSPPFCVNVIKDSYCSSRKRKQKCRIYTWHEEVPKPTDRHGCESMKQMQRTQPAPPEAA